MFGWPRLTAQILAETVDAGFLRNGRLQGAFDKAVVETIESECDFK